MMPAKYARKGCSDCGGTGVALHKEETERTGFSISAVCHCVSPGWARAVAAEWLLRKQAQERHEEERLAR